MRYSVGKRLSFKILDKEIANEIDSLMITANILGKKVETGRYNGGDIYIEIDDSLEIAFRTNYLGYLSLVIVRDFDENFGQSFRSPSEMLRGIKIMQELL